MKYKLLQLWPGCHESLKVGDVFIKVDDKNNFKRESDGKCYMTDYSIDEFPSFFEKIDQ